MAFDPKTLASFLSLLNNPVNARLRDVVIEIAQNDITDKTWLELEQKLDTVHLNVGSIAVPGSDMISYFCEMAGMDNKRAAELMLAAGHYFVINGLLTQE